MTIIATDCLLCNTLLPHVLYPIPITITISSTSHALYPSKDQVRPDRSMHHRSLHHRYPHAALPPDHPEAGPMPRFIDK